MDSTLIYTFSILGNHMGFRVRVFLQNSQRPKGKKCQFYKRLVYGVATHNVGRDDIVVFARTADRLQKLLDHVSEWANTWEMSVGHAKCGV